ncbi:MAG: Tetratricopeptide domain protein [Verrucomicrobiales bacterium]|nr:Tetratricopeptide domain protein [Verrucomicrobiales bacterium]
MSATSERLPPPADARAFEALCFDLWKEIWQDPHAQQNGRSGQPQAGVDIFGQHAGGLVGVQCKQKDAILWAEVNVRELEDEVVKAKKFQPPLTQFILATSGPADVKVQQRARELSARHKQEGLFTVAIWSWREIWTELYSRPELFGKLGPVYWPRLWAAFTRRRERNEKRPPHNLLDQGIHRIATRPPARSTAVGRSRGNIANNLAGVLCAMSFPISFVVVLSLGFVWFHARGTFGLLFFLFATFGAVVLFIMAGRLIVLSFQTRTWMRRALSVGDGFAGHTGLMLLADNSKSPPRNEELREEVQKKETAGESALRSPIIALLRDIWPYRWGGSIFVVQFSPLIEETMIDSAIKGCRSTRSTGRTFFRGGIFLICFTLAIYLFLFQRTTILWVGHFVVMPLLAVVGAMSILDFLVRALVNIAFGEKMRRQVAAWQTRRNGRQTEIGSLYFAAEGISADPLGGHPVGNDKAAVWLLDDVGRILSAESPAMPEPSELHNSGMKWKICVYGTLHNQSLKSVEVWDLSTRLYHASGQDRPLMCCLHRPRIELLQGNSILESGKTYLVTPGDSLPVEVVFETSLFDTQVSTLIFGLFFRYHLLGNDSDGPQSACVASDALFAFEHAALGRVDHVTVYVITNDEARLRSSDRLDLQAMLEKHRKTGGQGSEQNCE